MKNLFVAKNSIVRKIWGRADTTLFIFAGAAAEFALNKAVIENVQNYNQIEYIVNGTPPQNFGSSSRKHLCYIEYLISFLITTEIIYNFAWVQLFFMLLCLENVMLTYYVKREQEYSQKVRV